MVTPYDLTVGENVRSGYFTTLEVVLKHFCSELESYFFDQFNISCQFTQEIIPAGKFGPYLNGIEQPTPIFVLGLSALGGEGLLVMGNPLANLILSRSELIEQGRAKISKDFGITMENYPALEAGTQDILKAFSNSWSRILPCHAELKKLVSHRIKAKIMNPEESCLKARINVSYKGFSSYLEFCFSAYGMDPILKKYGKKALLAGEPGRQPAGHEPLERIIEQEAQYRTTAVLGELYLSREELEQCQQSGEVLPIKSDLKGLLTVQFNGEPMLSGEPGSSLGHQAVQINGLIEDMRQQVKRRPLPFEKNLYDG